jgi:hypothetical protein
MNLRRYNEILFAVLLTGVLLGLIAHGIHFVSHRHAVNRPAEIPGATVDGPRDLALPGKSSVALCLPAFAVGTDYQYFPVTRVGAALDDTHGPCHLGGGTSGGIFDVVIRNSASNEQRLLLNHPGQVLDMTLPDSGCAAGAGSVPCGTIFWLVRDEDSNQDGVIDARDNTILYVSDLSARELFRISPKDASVIEWTWNSRSSEVLLQVQRAAGVTEVVNARLQPAAPGTVIVQPRVLEQLQRAVQ